MQHTIQKCTLYVNVFCLKIPYNTDGQKSTLCCTSPNSSPGLKEINSVDLFKTLSNIFGLETLDLTLGATLYLQNPFRRKRPTTSGQLTELEYIVLT